MRGLGVAVLVGVVVVLWLVNRPAELAYHDGTRPVADSYEHGCPGDEAGMKNCSTVTAFRWRLPGHGTANTTLRVSRDDATALSGRLVLAGRCPARIAWELTVNARTVLGALTARDRSAALDVAVTGPLPEVRLTLRRTDSASCASEFRWEDPGVTVPAFSLPF